MVTSGPVAPATRAGDGELARRYRAVRAATVALTADLAIEDMVVQSMPDASPVRWHLAHTTWFFETFVLAATANHRPFRAGYDVLFNSYYNTVGAQFPRAQRGLITRPTVAEILDYRHHVDERIAGVMDDGAALPGLAPILEVGIHHEQQHQELLLTDLKHLLSWNPLTPTYRNSGADTARAGKPGPLSWHGFEEAVRAIGHDGPGFAFDNERPHHRRLVHPFAIADRLTTCGEYLQFIDDGGYRRPELWLSNGWAEVERAGWQAPLYWRLEDGRRQQFTLSGLQPIDPSEPVCHVSYYEADAYARWAGARLPTEDEWEVAVGDRPIVGNLAEGGWFHPRAAPERGGPEPGGTDPGGLRQLYGDVWEWTGSPYVGYPGYVAPPGAIGEYNGKFMCDQWVLRGGSCVTPADHLRPTYRNFFPAPTRWQFAGIRLARNPEEVR